MTAHELAVAVLVVLAACKAPASGAAAPDSTSAEHDPLGDAELRLADNASRMRALGIEVPERADGTRALELDDAPKNGPGTKAPRDDPGPVGDNQKIETKPSATVSPPPKPSSPAPEPETPAPTVEPPAEPATPTRERDRCTQVCELAEVACGLEQQVCRLAELHVGEPRYEDACWRARDQCERGQDACAACSAC